MGSSDRRARVTYFELGEEDLAVLAFPVASGRVLDELTPAEREVSVLVLAGCSNREIASTRCTSVRTVANQLATIYRKLGIRSRQELAVRLMEP